MTLDAARDALNRAALADHDLDAVVCRFPANVLSLTGYWPLSGNAFVVYPASGPVTLIVDETELWAVPDDVADEVVTFSAGRIGDPDLYESIERLVGDAGRRAGLQHSWIGIEHGPRALAVGHQAAEPPVGVDATRRAVGRALPDASISFAGPALRQSQARKTPRDIERLRLSGRAAAEGLRVFFEMFEAGRSEIEIASAVERAAALAGFDQPEAREARAWAQLTTGPASALAWVGHPWTSTRRIERGDLGVLELGVVVGGYWSDLTRTRVAGSAVSDQVQTMYEAVVAAREAVISRARAGMTGAEVDSLARAEVVRRDLGSLFVHQTGHGLGFSYHEAGVALAPGNSGRLESGMVASVEPGLYAEGLGGMRLEENVVFSGDGVELLVDVRYDLTG